jgi:REP element-mobilizing transposase RayT
MARQLRIDVAHGWHHVTNRGTDRRVIFTDSRCYEHFLELMTEVGERFSIRLHAYVLMPNHFHLVIETVEANLSGGMQWLTTSYAMWFNRRERRVGPLFQGRFKAVLFDGRTEAWPVTRYVHLNPVRVSDLDLGKEGSKAEAQGLVRPTPEMLAQRRKTLDEYVWSSYPAYAGWKKTPEWLDVNAVLSDGKKRALTEQRKSYRRYVEGVLMESLPDSPMEKASGGLILGADAWVEKMRKRLRGDRVEQKALRRMECRPSWKNVRTAVEKVKKESWESFAERHGDWGRDMALYLGRRYAGLSLRVLAAETGIRTYQNVAQAIHRMTLRTKNDSACRNLVAEAIRCLNVKTCPKGVQGRPKGADEKHATEIEG